MEHLVVSDMNKNYEEILTDIDYASFYYEYEKNISRSITFDVIRTPFNDFSFNLLNNESIVAFKEQQYVVKTCDINMSSAGIEIKSVTAHHIMYEFQNHAVYDVVSGPKSYTLNDVLKIAFTDNTLGYTYKIEGSFNTSTIEDLGDLNGIEFVTLASENFGCVSFADNKQIIFYDEETFYKKTENTLRYRYNTDDVKVSTNTQELKTVAKVYGKKKDKQETTYSQQKTTDLTLVGTFVKKGTYYTEKENDYYTSIVDVKWTGDSLDFKFKKDKLGGLWDIYLDSMKVKTLSAYSKNAKTETVNLSNNLSKGKHTIKCVFIGEDPEHKMTKNAKARGYIGTETATIFVVNANLTGDNAYHVTTVYTSDTHKVYGNRMAKALYNESATTVTALLSWAKTQLLDVPETKLDLKYTDTETITERDSLYFVHEPLNFSTDLKIIKIKKSHDLMKIPIEIGFSNSKKDIVNIQYALANNIKQATKKMVNTEGIVNAAQQIANEAYQSILVTEYEGEVDDD